jgi:hypothetical protein
MEINYYLSVLVGIIIYILIQLNGIYNSQCFKWSIFVKTNWVPTLLNLIIGWGLVFIRADLVNIYPITLVSALILGLNGQLLIKKLSNVFDKKLDTVVSV